MTLIVSSIPAEDLPGAVATLIGVTSLFGGAARYADGADGARSRSRSQVCNRHTERIKMTEGLISHDEVLAEELRDPEFRAEWERTALARWLATEVAHYRAEHCLSQRRLAERLGVHQSDVARMESGEHTPSLDRLARIAVGLDIEVMIDIRPREREARLPRKRALDGGSFSLGGCEVVLATA